MISTTTLGVTPSHVPNPAHAWHRTVITDEEASLSSRRPKSNLQALLRAVPSAMVGTGEART